MSDAERLTEEDVREIARLVRELEHSDVEFLRVELGALKVTISKTGRPEAPLAGAPAAVPAAPAFPPEPPQGGAPAAAAPVAAADAGGLAIRAPTLGRFYAQAEPGAPPFVRLGSEVGEDSTVGLLEVMKVFNAVSAGLRGVISEICVRDAQFVEQGQVLFRLQPAAAG